MKSLLVLTCLVAVCLVATEAASVDTRALMDLLQSLEKRRRPKQGEDKPEPECVPGCDENQHCFLEGTCVDESTKKRSLLSDLQQMEKRRRGDKPPPPPPVCNEDTTKYDGCDGNDVCEPPSDSLPGICLDTCTGDDQCGQKNCLRPYKPPPPEPVKRGGDGETKPRICRVCKDDLECDEFNPGFTCDSNGQCTDPSATGAGKRSLINDLQEMLKNWE